MLTHPKLASAFTSRIVPARAISRPPRLVIVNQISGQPFNENVAQVKRLITRDRKEFLGNSEDILDKYNAEFGSEAATQTIEANPFTSPAASTSTAPAAPASPDIASSSKPSIPSISVAKSDNPFKAAASSPFSSSPAAPKQPFKQSIEPKGLTPDMSPDPVVKETPFNFIANIGITQIVIVMSFSLIIGLMIATFFVVLNAGGIRIAGLD